MASPDFSEYIDLRVNDLQPAELYAAALDYARTALPEFEPRAGSVEDAVLQAFSLINSLYIAAVNRVPDGTIEGVLRLFGLERREAGVSTINAEFSLLTAGGQVEQGTSVYYLTEENGEVVQYSFFVQETATAEAGSNTVTAILESLVIGPLPVIPVGTPLTIAQTSSEILTCVTTSTPSSASTGESDIEYLTRGVTYLNSLSTSLCTASQIESYILSAFQSISRCKVYDLTYGPATCPALDMSAVSTINGSAIDVEIQCTAGGGDFFAFNEGLGLVLDGEPVWVTTQSSYDNPTVTKEIFPSGLMADLGGLGQTTAFDYTNNVITISTIPSITPTASTELGRTMVQVLSGMSFSVLNNLSPSSRTPDSRGMYVIFLWGENGYPPEFEVLQSIYEELRVRTPVGFDAFLNCVMPVDISVQIQVEVLDGFVSSSVLLNVDEFVDSHFSPLNYPNWAEFIYRNEIVTIAASVPGVKRVVSVSMSIPTYGAGEVTTTSGSSYLNNEYMASLDALNPSSPDYIQFNYAGTMPKFTTVTTEYGA